MFQKIKSKIQLSKLKDYRAIFFYALFLFKKFIVFQLINQIVHFICILKEVKIGKNTKFNGFPNIHRYPNSSITIGSGCTFNSSRYSLSIGLNQPCSFVTLNENAKIIFGDNSGASGLKIAARSTVKIGNNVLIGAGCIMLDNDAHNSNLTKRVQKIIPARPIIIEDNVFVGLECVILKGVKIGKNTVIGARSVVISNIPENSIAMGNPCTVIFKRKST